MTNEYIVGIDPGRTCGYAVIDTDGSLCTSGVIKSRTAWTYDEVICNHVDEIERLVASKYSTPDAEIVACVIEAGFFFKNPRTAQKLSELRGAIKYMFHKYGVQCLSPAPKSVKKVFGGGSRTKREIAINLASKFNINIDHIVDNNETDAISMAYFALITTKEPII